MTTFEQGPGALAPGGDVEPDATLGSRSAGPAPTPGGGRPTDLVLARLHLRVGLLGLARSELETLAGTAELDLPGILDLAEVRWRTGDLPGAGEAAAAYLALVARARAVPDGPLAHAIVAEAAARRGHEAEAAEAVAGALAIVRAGLADEDALEPTLDRLFAGIVPLAPWPEGERAAVAPAALPRHLPWEAPPEGADGGLGPGSGAPPDDLQGRGASTADTLLAAGLDALRDAEPGRAAVALGLALRSDPSCAAAIITAVDEAGTFAAVTGAGEASPGLPAGGIDPGLASLAVVHGDALRAAGRDDEAVLAYDLARQLAAGIGETVISPAAVTAEPAPAGEDGGPPLAGGSA